MPGKRQSGQQTELRAVIVPDSRPVACSVSMNLVRFALPSVAPSVDWDAIDSVLAATQAMLARQREETIGRLEKQLAELSREKARLTREIVLGHSSIRSSATG